ncbi:MAG: transposase [Myxococcales bacterium]|nr:transposase [Myxococcales bacterium]
MNGLRAILERLVRAATTIAAPGPKGDLRRFLRGVSWVLRTGAPWRELPHVYGHRNSVFRRGGTDLDEPRRARLEARVPEKGAVDNHCPRALVRQRHGFVDDLTGHLDPLGDLVVRTARPRAGQREQVLQLHRIRPSLELARDLQGLVQREVRGSRGALLRHPGHARERPPVHVAGDGSGAHRQVEASDLSEPLHVQLRQVLVRPRQPIHQATAVFPKRQLLHPVVRRGSLVGPTRPQQEQGDRCMAHGLSSS